jgi:hypothetical protein
MSKHRWTGYVIKDKAVIMDREGIVTMLVQMEKGIETATSWTEWITFCLNYWEEKYGSTELDFAVGWAQVKDIKS